MHVQPGGDRRKGLDDMLQHELRDRRRRRVPHLLGIDQLSGERVDRLGVPLACPVNPWRRCTLDGYVVERDMIWEAKHSSAFAKA